MLIDLIRLTDCPPFRYTFKREKGGFFNFGGKEYDFTKNDGTWQKKLGNSRDI